MKDCKLSLFPYSLVTRLDEEHLCLCPPIKLLTNNLLNSSKEPIVFGGILLNHTRDGPLRVVRKALHIISSGTPYRCIVVLKVAMWSHGLRVQSYESNASILNLEGKGWLLTEAMKGELVRWTKSSTWFVLFHILPHLIHSPPHLIHFTFQVWHPKRRCPPWVILVLNIFSFSNFLTWAYPSTHRSWHCLLWLISWVSFLF